MRRAPAGRGLWREAAVLALAAVGPALVCGAVQLQFRPAPEPLAAGEVRVAEARPWARSALFLDARPRARYEAGHIPGALLLNEDEWEGLLSPVLDRWEPDQRVVVYCDGGGCEASHKVAERLREQLQMKEVYVLKGGWPAWEHE